MRRDGRWQVMLRLISNTRGLKNGGLTPTKSGSSRTNTDFASRRAGGVHSKQVVHSRVDLESRPAKLDPDGHYSCSACKTFVQLELDG